MKRIMILVCFLLMIVALSGCDKRVDAKQRAGYELRIYLQNQGFRVTISNDYIVLSHGDIISANELQRLHDNKFILIATTSPGRVQQYSFPASYIFKKSK